MQNSNKFEKVLRRQSFAFLAVAFLSGVSLVMLGYFVQAEHPFIAAVTIPLASAIIGACIGLALGNIFDASSVFRIRQLIESALHSPILASEEELNHFRMVWYQYFVTYVDGKVQWRYRQYKFDSSEVPGKLVFSVKIDNPNSGPAMGYKIEGYVIGDRLLLVQVPKSGGESPIIQIFPHGGDHFRSVHAGLSFLETWDGDHKVVPVLFSQTKLIKKSIREGSVDEENSEILEAKWNEEWNKSDNIDSILAMLNVQP